LQRRFLYSHHPLQYWASRNGPLCLFQQLRAVFGEVDRRHPLDVHHVGRLDLLSAQAGMPCLLGVIPR
jgi:hypothetical protein